MSSWGSADFKELKEFQKKLQQLEDDRSRFCEQCSKALAGRLLAMAIKRTPVGVKANDSEYWDGYVGGNLRRNWTGGKTTGAVGYANNLPVYKNGDNYTIVVENPTEYASYVEFGHRQTPGKYVPALGKKLKASWVNGKYMLTLSEKDLERIAPDILEKQLNKFFTEVLDGR